MKAVIFCCFAALLCCSCAATLQRTNPVGEHAHITLQDRDLGSRTTELMAVDDSTLCYRYGGDLVRVPWSDVRRVSVAAYATYNASKWVLAVPTFLLGAWVLNDAADNGRVLEGFGIVAAVGGLCAIMQASGPRGIFVPPLKEKDLALLRLYCRYPQGLSAEQWERLTHVPGKN